MTDSNYEAPSGESARQSPSNAVPPPGDGAAVPPAHFVSSKSPERNRRTLGTTVLVVGLLIAAATFLSWFRISFGAFEASVNGWGHETTDSFPDDNSSSGDTTGESDSSNELGWIAEPIPDGTVVCVLGLALATTGFLLRKRAADTARTRTVSWLMVGGAALGFLWIAWSWLRVDNEFSRQMRKAVEDEPLAAMFVGSVSLDRGYGLMAAAAGFIVVGVVGILSLRDSRPVTAI